jgi:hypothetical protein
VHLSDIIRAHEGNLDYNPNDPTQLHWAKFAMIGKFIAGIVQGQVQCRAAQDYNFAERPHILRLIFRGHLMDEQVRSHFFALANCGYIDFPSDAEVPNPCK